MPIIATQTVEYTPHEAGTFPAVCCGIIDLGLHTNEYQGETKTRHQIAIYFDTGEEGSPMVGWYTLSLHPQAKLRKHLESWRGKPFTAEESAGFDISKLVGHKCVLTIAHNENGKANISMVSKAMKGVDMSSEIEPFIVEAGGVGMDQPECVGDRIWQMMLDGYAALKGKEAPKSPVREELDDDIPF